MTLPEKGEWLDEVIFADIEEEKAKEMVAKYNKDGKSAGYGTGVKRTPRRDWHKRKYTKKKKGNPSTCLIIYCILRYRYEKDESQRQKLPQQIRQQDAVPFELESQVQRSLG